MSEESRGAGTSSSSPLGTRPKDPLSVQARTLPPIQSAIPTSASYDAPQSTVTAPYAPMRPTPPSSTPPDQRTSRPIGVQNLLNPAGSESLYAQARRGNGGPTDSPPTPSSMGPTSRGVTPLLSTAGSGPSRSPVNVSLPTATAPLMGTYSGSSTRALTPRSPHTWPQPALSRGPPSGSIDARESPFLVPRDQQVTGHASGPATYTETVNTPSDQNTATRSYAATLPRVNSPPRRNSYSSSYPQPWQHYQRSEATNPSSRPAAPISQQSDSPGTQYSSYSQSTAPASLPSTTATGQPQSFFSNPFPTARSASTIPQAPFSSTKSFDVPTSSATAQSQYQMMTLETENGPIQVPVDVQAASKVADEKRKRNATASHRFRQRRKEKERETSESISKLEAQIREMAEEREFYQKERDYFQEMALRHRVPVGPRPPSPRRRRHATMGGSVTTEFPDGESTGRGGRQTRRRTTAYVPASGPPQPSPAEEASRIPSFEQISALPSEVLQSVNRSRPQGLSSYPPPSSYHQAPPR